MRRRPLSESSARCESACKPDSVEDDHPSRRTVTDALQRPTRDLIDGPSTSLLGLAPGGVCQAAAVTCDAGELLPHRFTLACAQRSRAIGGLLSVALSIGSPRLGVAQHPALWSPDFPRSCDRGRPAGSQTRFYRLLRPARAPLIPATSAASIASQITLGVDAGLPPSLATTITTPARSNPVTAP